MPIRVNKLPCFLIIAEATVALEAVGVDSGVAAGAGVAEEALCATSNLMEIVGVLGATHVTPTPHPLPHLICVSAWMVT